MEEKIKKLPHTLIIESRSRLSLSGVTEIGSYDEESLTVYTDFGEITVTGEGLKVTVMNTETGMVSADGKINSVKFSDRTSKRMSLMSRLMK
ncbi:MAG: hypothetical protein IKB08_09765 [Clostridia bacterium]|nr:hypothetical protein [Oscillospiraceae bacterium]MBR2411994.1 hypothetical protein [Clostridia bacterium]